jgi:NHL repeat-containing protein/6-bladed beta-propeller protein
MRATASLALLLVLAGCSPVPGPPATPTVAPVVWPAAPAPARIRFVRSVARPEDVGIQPSFWRRLGRLIAGGSEEWMIRPTAVASNGPVLYIADAGAQALLMIDTERGRFLKVTSAKDQPFASPVAVALGRDRVYLADSFLGKIFVYDLDLDLKHVIVDPDLQRPAGLAFDRAADRLYVADARAHRVSIFTGEGRRVGAIGHRGTGDGEFNFPTHVAVDGAGTIYVTDALGFRIEMFEPDGRFRGAFGRHGDGSGQFATPKGVAVDSEGHVYVVEPLFDAVQIFDRRGRFLMSFGDRGLRPGQFWLPVGVFIDTENRIYVADSYNQRIQVFQYLGGPPDGD